MSSEEGWYVPGGAAIAEGGEHKIRLRPPTSWHRVVLEIPRVPPSMNDNKIRSNWRGFHNAKRDWQEEIGMLLIEAKTPRRNRRAIAGAVMRFRTRSRRDPSNFRGLLDKALGDALVVSPETPLSKRYIPDDDAPHYFFGGVEFAPERGPALTTIVIYLQPEEQP